MDLTSIRYFAALANTLHFTKTAQELYISQQNLSQHIKKLEDYYGTPLFYRKPKLQLTPAGVALYGYAKKIIIEADNADLRINEMRQNNTGSISVGASPYRGYYWLPKVLPDYMKTWPNVAVKLTMEPSAKMENLLLSGDLDFFVGLKKGTDPVLVAIPLMKDKVYLAASKELLQSHFGDETDAVIEKFRNGTDLKPFKTLPFIRLKSNFMLRSIVDSCFAEAGFEPVCILEAERIEFMISLLPYSIGAFFCTGMRIDSIRSEYPDAVFIPILKNNDFVYSHLNIVYHKDRFMPNYALDFIKRLRTFFEPYNTAGI